MRVGKEVIVNMEISKDEANKLMVILANATDNDNLDEALKEFAGNLLYAIKLTNINN